MKPNQITQALMVIFTGLSMLTAVPSVAREASEVPRHEARPQAVKIEKVEKIEKAAKPEKVEKAEKLEKLQKPEKIEKVEKVERKG